jgi:hypothetical protein
MEQNETLGGGEEEPQGDNSGEPSSSKRLKTPSAKVQDQDGTPKLPQMVISNELLIFVAKCIQADPDAWGILLTTKHGKTGVANKFVKGMDRAEEETSRRATGNASGRGAANGSVPEVDKVWFELMEVWNEYLKEKPATDRYNTPPKHLEGIVALKKDDSPLLPCGRQEKAAGDAQREAAISKLAEQRDSARKETPESKEHLKPKRLKVTTADESGGGGADEKIIQAYMSMEMTRGQQEVRASKVAELQKYTEMLANPNLPSEAKNSVAALLQNVANELTQIQKSEAAAASGGSGDGGFATPTPATPSKPRQSSLSSSGSERGSQLSTPNK